MGESLTVLPGFFSTIYNFINSKAYSENMSYGNKTGQLLLQRCAY